MKIGIVGLGKLGLCMAGVFAEHFEVFGVDRNPQLIKAVKSGLCPLKEPNLAPYLSNKNLTVSEDYNILNGVDIVFIIVATLSEPSGAFSNKYIDEVLGKISVLRVPIVISSTVMPGTCHKRNKDDIKIIYNPEFIALGNVVEGLKNPDMILIGESKLGDSLLLDEIYGKICLNKPPIFKMNLWEAEITKLCVNCFLTLKISFANYIADVCEGLKVEPKIILEAVGQDNRIGQQFLKPGLGFGGPCLPRDVLAFIAFAKEQEKPTELMEAIHNINENIITKIMKRIKKLKPEIIGFESLSYKPGTDITEGSQLFKLYCLLKSRRYDIKMGQGDVTLNHWGMK